LANSVVLDSSAILAVVFNEPGAEKVVGLLNGGLLSSVNLAEVHTRLILCRMPPDFARSRVMTMGCEICFFDEHQAYLAGELAAITHPYGLSVGDRACIALAIERNAKVYTADRTWKNLNLGIEVEVIR
jgi:ribonuclease VapC